MGAGFRVFIGLGCEIGKGNRAGYGIHFQRNFMAGAKPEAGCLLTFLQALSGLL